MNIHNKISKLTLVSFLSVISTLLFFSLRSLSFASENINDSVATDGGEYSEGGNFGLYGTFGENSVGYSSEDNLSLLSGSKYYYGYVIGGNVLDTDGVNNNLDIDITTNNTRLFATWSGFTAIDTVIDSYEIAIGNGIQSDFARTHFLDWTNVGNVNSHEISINLKNDIVYYVSVRAVTSENSFSTSVASDGVHFPSENKQLLPAEVVLEELEINDIDVIEEGVQVITDNGEGVRVKGKVSGADSIYIYLYDNDGLVIITQPTLLRANGEFEFEGEFDIPDGEYPFHIVAVQNDGREITLYSTIYIKDYTVPSVVLENLIINENPITGADAYVIYDFGEGLEISGTVSGAEQVYIYIYDENGNIVFQQLITLNPDGTFSFTGNPNLPAGTYILKIIAIGEDEEITILYSTTYVVTEKQEYISEPSIVNQIIEILRDDVLKKINEDIIIPVITAGVILTGIATLIGVFTMGIPVGDLPRILERFVFAIFGLFRKEEYWGIVFDASTGDRLPYAYLKLVDAKTDKIVMEYITDATGRYGFAIGEGDYRIEVERRGYSFLKKSLGGEYYTGENFTVGKDSKITFDIPLSTVEQKQIVKHDKYGWLARRVAKIFTLIGMILTIISFIIEPTPLNIFCVVIYVFLVLLMSSVGKFIDERKLKNYVLDSSLPKGVPFSRIRIFDKNKDLKDIAITDEKGRFGSAVSLKQKVVNVVKSGFSFPSSSEKRETFLNGSMVVLDKKTGNKIYIDPK